MDPPGTLAVRHGTVRLPTGLRLHYVEQGDPAGPPVVLVHGWPDSWFTWSRMLPSLDSGLRVYAIDQRGFGDSDHPDSGYEIDDLADDVAAFSTAMGLERPHLVGHSLGTFVIRRAAERHPGRFARLVLIGSADRMGRELIETVRAAIADLSDPVPPDWVREFQAGTVHRPVPPEFFDQVVRESQKLPAHVYRDVWEALAVVDDRTELRRISAPTLLVWGDRDALFDRGQQDRLLAALPDARVLVYPDTGHCPNWERPAEVAVEVNRFLLGD
jgi:pimeloyl-ACP methyl ester carboxylesterase